MASPHLANVQHFDRSKSPKHEEDRLKASLEQLLQNDAQYRDSTIETTIACALNIKAAHDEFNVRPKDFHIKYEFDRRSRGTLREVRAKCWQEFRQQSFHASDISYHLAIANNPHLTKKSNWPHLPAGFSVLYPIARLTQDDGPAEFKRRLRTQICARTTRSEANDLLAYALGKPTREQRLNKQARQRRNLKAAPQEIEELEHYIVNERRWRQSLYPVAYIDAEATILTKYLQALNQQYADGAIDKRTLYCRVTAVCASNRAARYAIFSSCSTAGISEKVTNISDATDELKQAMIESATLAEISDYTHLDVSGEEMRDTEETLRQFSKQHCQLETKMMRDQMASQIAEIVNADCRDRQLGRRHECQSAAIRQAIVSSPPGPNLAAGSRHAESLPGPS
ncbi:MAG: hypothetical protein ABSG56_34580 [Bryobacteraceae bacterium]|jgi:hypothetical protein